MIAAPIELDVRHPAVYGKKLFPIFAELVDEYDIKTVLDPFAGKGGIFRLWETHPHLQIKGIELEPKWAACHWATEVGDALNLPYKWTGRFDAIFTSPTFGNRMADNFEDHKPEKSYIRNTYRHSLGNELHPNNSGKMHFGCDYAVFHRMFLDEAWRCLADGGLIGVEAKDFYKTKVRKGAKILRRVRVTLWFYHSLTNKGFTYVKDYKVYSRGNQQGANRQRVPYSKLFVFQKSSK